MAPRSNPARGAVFAAAALALAALLAWPPATAAQPAQPQQPGEATTVDSPEEGVANLPFARGRRFGTLDAYLAHLRKQGEIDLPWWREIRPGVYEQVTTMRGGAPPETATREELMRRYGFTR